MAASLPSVPIPPNTWVDLYDATGITLGVQIIVQNIGTSEVKLTESVAEPVSDDVGGNPLQTREFFTNDPRNVGAWAFANTGSLLQVEIL